MQLGTVPVIDYEHHPAFAGMQPASDPAAETQIEQINEAYGRLQGENASPELLCDAFDSDVAPKIEALTRHLAAAAKPRSHALLTQAMAIACNTLRNDLGARNSVGATKNSGAESLSGHFADGLSAMRQGGFYSFRSPQLAKFAWLTAILERSMLRLKSRQAPARHCVMPLHANSLAGWMIRRAMEKSGAMDLVSAYLGKPVEFYYAAMDHAHPGQVWYQDCYDDTRLGTTKTVYMHTDADSDIVKAMMYLRDVGEKDGPFCFLPGSHKWKRSPLAMAVQKGFDEASGRVFAGRPDNGDYYRPRFRHVESRQDMLSLPLALRGSTHFGDDILDGSDLSESLLAAEKRFIAPAGTIVIFDGSRGIHRGGLVQPGGQRWAVQMAFRVRKSPAPSGWKAYYANARGFLSYFKYVIVRACRLALGRTLT